MVSDRGMKCLWGRKISYLLFAEFLSILEWMAGSADTTIVKIDRWAPSNKTYRVGGTVNADLTLKPSSWTCEFCLRLGLPAALMKLNLMVFSPWEYINCGVFNSNTVGAPPINIGYKYIYHTFNNIFNELGVK